MDYKIVLAALLALAGPSATAASVADQGNRAGEGAVSALAPGAHTIRVDGVRIWYRVAGKPDGVPLVFLHGGPGEGSQTFQAVGGPALEKTQRVVYLDQRGSGRSERPKDARFYSIPILVEDVEALRKALGVERIALLGHSFGTILALEYAARHPDHVAAVVLAAAVPDIPRVLDIQCATLERDDPAAFARARGDRAPDAYPRCDSFSAYPGPEMKAYVYRNMFPDPATGELVDRLDAVDGLGNSGEMGGAIFEQGLTSYRFTDVDRIAAPVLVVAGGRDFQAAIAPQRTLAHALKHGRLLEYRENGHFMFAEAPERFARDVGHFLDRATR